MRVRRSRVVSIDGLRHARFGGMSNECLTLLFGRGFCNVCGRRGRMSYDKILFGKASNVIRLQLPVTSSRLLRRIISEVIARCVLQSGLRKRVLHLLLGHFVVLYAQLTHGRLSNFPIGRGNFSVVRHCCILISGRFGRGGRMRTCTTLLRHSPGALSGLFTTCNVPSPLGVVRRQIIARTGQLLLRASRDVGRVSIVLNFRDINAFDHFFGGVAKRGASTCQGELRWRRPILITISFSGGENFSRTLYDCSRAMSIV